jgi:integrase
MGPAHSDWLFPSAAGTPLGDRDLTQHHLWPACARLGIPPFGWHSFRHTFGICNRNASVSVLVPQSPLEDASLETTMVFTHPSEDVKRRAVEDMARLLSPEVSSEQELVTKGSG